VDHDFYDIVGARVYAEVLGWIRNRLKDPYQLIGVIDGHVVAFWNGRLMNEDINISLHSMAFRAPERPLPRVVSLGDIQLIPSIANSGEAPPDAVEAPCAAKCSPASTVVSINSARDFEQIQLEQTFLASRRRASRALRRRRALRLVRNAFVGPRSHRRGAKWEGSPPPNGEEARPGHEKHSLISDGFPFHM
jgi:hypothetical protein